MNVEFKLITAPTIEPVTLTEAKEQVRRDDTAADTFLTTAIKAARGWVEDYLSRAVLTQTWRYAQDEWTDEMILPRSAPLQSVTWVKYYDAAGVEQTLSSSVYLVDTMSEPGRIVLAPQQSWPTIQSRPLAVSVQYVCGWTAAADVPDQVKWAVRLKVAALDADRGDGPKAEQARAEDAAMALLAPWRLWWRGPSC